MLKAVSLQKVHFARRTFFYKLQIWALHIFPLGGVKQNKGGDRGADLPNVNPGGGVWRNPRSFPWFLFHLSLGQHWHPQEAGGSDEDKSSNLIPISCVMWNHSNICVISNLIICLEFPGRSSWLPPGFDANENHVKVFWSSAKIFVPSFLLQYLVTKTNEKLMWVIGVFLGIWEKIQKPFFFFFFFLGGGVRVKPEREICGCMPMCRFGMKQI